MNNKPLIYKPSIDYHYTNKRTKNKEESISLKDWIKEVLISWFIFLLVIIIFVLSVAIAYNAYLLIKFKLEKTSLINENRALKKEYQYLTSKEVILKKAKALGLRPPQENDFLRFE